MSPDPTITSELTQEQAREILRRSVARGTISTNAYARYVALRSPRQVRRWLAGDSDIPPEVVAMLADEAEHAERIRLAEQQLSPSPRQ